MRLYLGIVIFCLSIAESGARGGRGGGGRGAGRSSGGSGSRGRSTGGKSGKSSRGLSMFSPAGRSSGSYKGLSSASPGFKAFAGGAAVGYIGHRTASYYFGYHGIRGNGAYTGNDGDVCKAEVEKSEIQNSSVSAEEITLNKNGKVDVYFLCDGKCCEAECCTLNITMIIIVVVVIVAVVVLCCLCCYCHKKKKRATNQVMIQEQNQYNSHSFHTQDISPTYPSASYPM